ncbi:MAG TPA: twin-arginine translocase TatA/TatE family subunit [Candidatus Cybelea sp.]|nr:twin-arginine translocase TatA/TatE family subunit [Candidatus Cybelea sp.]
MLSIPHLIIIFVVALIVFGPEKLPELARNLGKVMAEFRRATGDLRSTFEDHLRDLEREAEERRIGGGRAREIPAAPPPSTVPAAAPPTLRPKPDLPLQGSEGSGPSGEAEPKVEDATATDGLESVKGSTAGSNPSAPSEPRADSVRSEDHSETLTDGHTPA